MQGIQQRSCTGDAALLQEMVRRVCAVWQSSCEEKGMDPWSGQWNQWNRFLFLKLKGGGQAQNRFRLARLH